MLLEEKVKISEDSEFLILSHTQNRKLGNLENFSRASDFHGSYNLRCKDKEKTLLRQKLKSQDMLFEEKSENIRSFGVFNFTLYTKLKTWKSRKNFSCFKF